MTALRIAWAFGLLLCALLLALAGLSAAQGDGPDAAMCAVVGGLGALILWEDR